MHNKSNTLKSGIAVCVALVIIVISSPVHAVLTGSRHDFTGSGSGPITNQTEKCSTCHVPHKPLLNVPLWAHSLSTYSYNLYNANGDYNRPNTAAYGGTSSDLTGSRSQLCLSCHDGTVAVAGTTYITQTSGTPPGSAWMLYDGGVPVGGQGTANPSSGLKGSHPIAVNYEMVLTNQGLTEFNSVASLAPDVKLEGTPGKVQCTSCHNPHNKAGTTKMLVMDNTGSALCLKCHNK